MDSIVPAPPLGTASAAADELAALDLERFIRRTVARGAASPDTVAGYLREARLFRDRFLAPRGLAIGALSAPATWRRTGASWSRRATRR